MGSLGRNPLLLALAVSCLLVLLQESTTVTVAAVDDAGVLLLDPIHVELHNYLAKGETITVHCKSKDDDLGTHVVKSMDKYEFRFSVNLFRTTFFFCVVSKQSGGQVVFDIFKANRDLGRCGYCKWEAREGAVVGYPEGEPEPDHIYMWEK